MLLDPASRLLSRVTLPEGLTVERTLATIAEETGRPVEEFQAAAADPAALGLPGLGQRTRWRACSSRPPTTSSPTHAPADVLPADGRPGRAGVRRAADPGGRPAHGADQGEPGAGRGQQSPRTWPRSPGCWRTGSPTACRCSWTPRSTTPTARAGITTTAAGPRQPLAVQHLRAHGPAAGRHQQPGRGRAAGGAAPDPRRLALLRGRRPRHRRHAVRRHQGRARRRTCCCSGSGCAGEPRGMSAAG